MSSGKLDKSGSFDVSKGSEADAIHIVPAGLLNIQKHGIEFKSTTPFALWKEMTVCLECSRWQKRTKFTGVVVSCSGSRKSGYIVSMLFTGLNRQCRERLNSLAENRSFI